METNNPGIHKIKIEPMDAGHAKIYIDGKPILATKIDVHMESNCLHQTDIRLFGEPEMEYESLVTFDFDPKTVKKAVDILKIALKRNDFIARLGLKELNEVKK